MDPLGSAGSSTPNGKHPLQPTHLPYPIHDSSQTTYRHEEPDYGRPHYKDPYGSTIESRQSQGSERLPTLRSVLDMPSALQLPQIPSLGTTIQDVPLQGGSMGVEGPMPSPSYLQRGSRLQDPNNLLMCSHYQLVIRQSPRYALVVTKKEKGRRKAIEPPPIIQLKTRLDRRLVENSHLFVSCSLLQASDDHSTNNGSAGLLGTLVSSAHRLLDTDNSEGTFFIFDDLSAEIVGTFRLHFILYELRETSCYDITSAVSETFTVHTKKTFPGILDSTPLTRSFADQGVRLKISKDRRHLGVPGMR